MAKRFRKKHLERDVARRRIEHLFEVARRRVREGETDWARRAVDLARRVAMRYQTGLPTHLRDQVCPGCKGPLVPGRTARVRVEQGKKSTTCLECGTVRRRPYRKEQRERRKARETSRSGRTVPVADRDEDLVVEEGTA